MIFTGTKPYVGPVSYKRKKKQCKFCNGFFVDLENHERTKHRQEEEFKFTRDLSLFICRTCKDNFLSKDFNHYSMRCKGCYRIQRKKEKIKCDLCKKMYDHYYFKNHTCKNGNRI